MPDRVIPFCLAFAAAVTWFAPVDADARGRKGGFVGRVLSAPARAIHSVAHLHHRAVGAAVVVPPVFAFGYPGRYFYPGQYFYPYPAPVGPYLYPVPPADVYPAPPPAYGYPDLHVYSDRNPHDSAPSTLSADPSGIAKQEMRVLSGPFYAIDGSTFIAENVHYRLPDIGTHEWGTLPAEKARARLQVLLESGPVTVYPVTIDNYGRTVAEVVVAGVNVMETLRSQDDANSASAPAPVTAARAIFPERGISGTAPPSGTTLGRRTPTD